MSIAIPETMQAVQLDQYGGPLAVRQLSPPMLKAGEVLIRMAASPINPSDLGMLAGGYEDEKPFPFVPGIEGSGTVVAAGSGLLPRLLMGRRVACAASSKSNGTWAEYMATPATLCFPLQKRVSLEQGAMLVVNPMTALAFFDIIKRGRHAAIVNTAAASQLGRMVLRLGLKRGVPVINIVRRQEQADLLYTLGAKYVLVSTDADFNQKLHTLAHQLNATLLLDAIGGGFTQQLIDAAPDESLILLYSNLSTESASIKPHSLWRHNRRVEGFYLATWAAKQSIFKILKVAQEAQSLISTDLQTIVSKRLPLSSVQEALDFYQKNMTAGKVLLMINPQDVSAQGETHE
jgi:NADPH:quinone reductase-like Zn-dependent oxidoreductase